MKYLHVLFVLMLLSVGATALAIEPPDPRLAMDLPADIRAWYRNLSGSCVQCSIGMCGVDQNVPAASTLLWDTECERLKHDFQTSPWLRALADPQQGGRSWAHYNIYRDDDRSQAWRWKNLRITTFPTVLVQPPRSGRYGDPQTVVYQGNYEGDPEALARDITRSIRRYVSNLKTPAPPVVAPVRDPPGINPPWQPAPNCEPCDEQILPNLRPLQIPPLLDEPPSLLNFPWSAVFKLVTAGFTLPAAVVLGIWLVWYIRNRRKEAGKELLLSDERFKELVEALQRLAGIQPDGGAETEPKPKESP